MDTVEDSNSKPQWLEVTVEDEVKSDHTLLMEQRQANRLLRLKVADLTTRLEEKESKLTKAQEIIRVLNRKIQCLEQLLWCQRRKYQGIIDQQLRRFLQHQPSAVDATLGSKYSSPAPSSTSEPILIDVSPSRDGSPQYPQTNGGDQIKICPSEKSYIDLSVPANSSEDSPQQFTSLQKPDGKMETFKRKLGPQGVIIIEYESDDEKSGDEADANSYTTTGSDHVGSCSEDEKKSGIYQELLNYPDTSSHLSPSKPHQPINESESFKINSYCEPLENEIVVETEEDSPEVITYDCDLCSKTFAQPGHLKLHKSTTHRRKFVNYSRRERIIQQQHDDSEAPQHRAYSCFYCSETFSEASYLKRHQRKVHSNKHASKDVCQSVRQDAKDNKKVQKGGTFVCGHCGKRFIRLNYLRLHERSKVCRRSQINELCHYISEEKKEEAESEVSPRRVHACDRCGKEYSRLNYLRLHQRGKDCSRFLPNSKQKLTKKREREADTESTQQDTHSCDLCGKKFSHSDQLKLHQQKKLCGRSISNPPFTTVGEKMQDKKHVTQHGKLACTLCGKVFSRLNYLKLHQRYKNCSKAVTNSRNKQDEAESAQHPCDQCGKAFSHVDKLKLHKLRKLCGKNPYTPPIEKNTQPFPQRFSHACGKCGKKFHQLNHLKNHQRHSACSEYQRVDHCKPERENIKNTVEAKSRKLDTYACDLCSKTCSHAYHLKLHRERAHSKIVKEMDSKPTEQPPHESSQHGTYACDECNNTFSQTNLLKLHKLTVHNKKSIKNSPSEAVGGGKQAETGAPKTKKFRCNQCGKSYGRPHHLRRHQLSHSIRPVAEGEEQGRLTKLDKHHKCETCGKSCPSAFHLSVHQKTHANERSHKCTMCKKAFLTSQKLSRHMKTHDQTRGQIPRHPYTKSTKENTTCGYCGKVFKYYCLFRVHQRIHTGERPYICKICGKTYGQLNSLRMHQKTHIDVNASVDKHEENLDERISFSLTPFRRGKDISSEATVKTKQTPNSSENQFVCGVSGEAHSQLSSPQAHYTDHFSSSEKRKEFQCTDCGKNLSSKDALQMHCREHTGEKPYSCPFCDQSFAHRSSLKIHQKRHAKHKQYSCSLCTKTFWKSSKLKLHMCKHAEEKPDLCSEVSTASRSSDLKAQTGTHTEEDPHVCQYCGRAFKSIKALWSHSKVHKGRKSQPGHTRAQTYGCQLCTQQFTNSTDLEKHQILHRKQNVHTCHDCGKTFSQAEVLRKHQCANTEEKPYDCAMCGESFDYIQSLQSHQRTEHLKTATFPPLLDSGSAQVWQN